MYWHGTSVFEDAAAFRDTFLGTRRDRADALAQAASLAMGVAVHS